MVAVRRPGQSRLKRTHAHTSHTRAHRFTVGRPRRRRARALGPRHFRVFQSSIHTLSSHRTRTHNLFRGWCPTSRAVSAARPQKKGSHHHSWLGSNASQSCLVGHRSSLLPLFPSYVTGVICDQRQVFGAAYPIYFRVTFVAFERYPVEQPRHEEHCASLFYGVCTPAHTTRGEQEPVHEDSFAIVVRVVSQEPMPLVLLLAAAVVVALLGLHGLADFLLYRLLQVLGVDNGPDLASAVRCPVRCDDLHSRLTGIHFVGRGTGERGAGPLRPGVDGLAVVRLVVVPVATVLVGRRVLAEHTPDQSLVLVDEHVDTLLWIAVARCWTVQLVEPSDAGIPFEDFCFQVQGAQDQ